MDGTLVGATDVLRRDVVDALRRAADLGVAVGYATGRMHAALRELDATLALAGPHVCHNGAQVRAADRPVAQWPLDADQVAALVAIAHDLDAYAELYLPEGYAITKDVPGAHAHWDLLGEAPLGGLEAVGDRPVLKATFIGFDAAESTAIVEALLAAGLEAGPAGSLLTPGITYVNATRPGVDKGNAIAAAAEAAGTTLERTCVVGDGDNDLPMLARAGTAIAMGQAADHVRAAAHLVAPHVDEGGLAAAVHAVLDLPAA